MKKLMVLMMAAMVSGCGDSDSDSPDTPDQPDRPQTTVNVQGTGNEVLLKTDEPLSPDLVIQVGGEDNYVEIETKDESPVIEALTTPEEDELFEQQKAEYFASLEVKK